MIDIHNIPARPQRQDSTTEQMADLVAVANRLGMYAAADAVQHIWMKNLPVLRYGCYCELEPHMEPDGCVLDEDRQQDCIYAKHGMRKEQCKYWRIVKTNAGGEN